MGLRPHYLADLIVGTLAIVTVAVLWYSARSIQHPSRSVLDTFRLSLAAVIIFTGVALSPMRFASPVSVHGCAVGERVWLCSRLPGSSTRFRCCWS